MQDCGVNKVYMGDLKMANSNICWFAADFQSCSYREQKRFLQLLGT